MKRVGIKIVAHEVTAFELRKIQSVVDHVAATEKNAVNIPLLTVEQGTIVIDCITVASFHRIYDELFDLFNGRG